MGFMRPKAPPPPPPDHSTTPPPPPPPPPPEKQKTPPPPPPPQAPPPASTPEPKAPPAQPQPQYQQPQEQYQQPQYQQQYQQPQQTGKKPKEKIPLNAGSYIGMVSVVIIIIGLLLPWYVVGMDIDSDYYDTDGRQDFISIGGIRGFNITIPENKNGTNMSSATGGMVNDNATEEFDPNEMTSGVPFLSQCTLCFSICLIRART